MASAPHLTATSLLKREISRLRASGQMLVSVFRVSVVQSEISQQLCVSVRRLSFRVVRATCGSLMSFMWLLGLGEPSVNDC